MDRAETHTESPVRSAAIHSSDCGGGSLQLLKNHECSEGNNYLIARVKFRTQKLQVPTMSAAGEGRPQRARVLSLDEVRLGVPPGWLENSSLAQFQECNGIPTTKPQAPPIHFDVGKGRCGCFFSPRIAPRNVQGEAATDKPLLNMD